MKVILFAALQVVCHHVHKGENHGLKEEMVLCLMELVKDINSISEHKLLWCTNIATKFMHNVLQEQQIDQVMESGTANEKLLNGFHISLRLDLWLL